MHSTIAVILGGGAGTRLFPLTNHRSKPAVPLAGKYRLIDVPISNCINSGVHKIFVLTQFNSASLNRHIANSYVFDRFSKGFVSILAAEQTRSSKDWFQGTADAVRQSLQHIDTHRHDDLLILSGDQLYAMDYRKMLAHHHALDADITIATYPVNAADATGFGILKTDDDGLITEFYEKPSEHELSGKESAVSEDLALQGRTFLASMGIYAFRSGILEELLDNFPDANDFGKQIIPSAIRTHKVASYAFSGYWSDIGTIQSFFEANLMVTQRHPPFSLYDPDMPLYTNARMLPPAKVQNSNIQDSMIAEACVVEDAQILNSVIGIRSYIGPNTTLKNTVMMGADYFAWQEADSRESVDGPLRPGVYEGSYIEGAIIDRNVRIGKRCVIRNKDGITEGEGPNFYIRDGIVVIPKNGIVPDDTII